jgi:transposase
VWKRLREILLARYIEIRNQLFTSAVLHAEETCWSTERRVLHRRTPTYYMIGRRRSSPALKRIFKTKFAGGLVTDFWGAYNAVVCARKQEHLPHLLRNLKRTQRYHKPEGDWPTFSKQL